MHTAGVAADSAEDGADLSTVVVNRTRLEVEVRERGAVGEEFGKGLCVNGCAEAEAFEMGKRESADEGCDREVVVVFETHLADLRSCILDAHLESRWTVTCSERLGIESSSWMSSSDIRGLNVRL